MPNYEPDTEYPDGTLVPQDEAKRMGAVTALTHKASQDDWDTNRSGRVRGCATLDSPPDTYLSYNIYDLESIVNPKVMQVPGTSRKTTPNQSNRRTTEVERMGLVNNIGEDYS